MNNGQQSSSSSLQKQLQQQQQDEQEEREREQKMHIKKPLNAFMIYMKEMRSKVIAESTLKESAAINQILGKKWQDLSRDEQEKYYDKARKERYEMCVMIQPVNFFKK
ncbi:hypothetical protein BLA29_002781 [Euroglyphus maynei]|uniref:dTCF n=1 Tax=Euroglyphus maynei TaxID=6958 RepID=A0A1Y3B742_EURMA|nr:hypothetical protein BLA29_002781 [Euroglyphus maynei]